MGKKSNKRRKLAEIGFKKGHNPHNKGHKIEREAFERKVYIRPEKEVFEAISEVDGSDGTLHVKDNEGQEVNVGYLRPSAGSSTSSVLEDYQLPETPDAEFETNRIFHASKLQDLWNSAFKDHSRFDSECNGDLTWDAAGEIQRGLGWRERLKCCKCGYTSPRHKLYTEVDSNKPGAKAAAVNYGVQVGLTHTSISNSGLNSLLLSMNVPSPSFSAMQNTANKVGDMIIEENERDLTEIRNFVKKGNTTRGLPESTPINISTDASYNNRPCSSNTPYQAGTQVVQVTTEKSTNKGFVIEINDKSKLCQTARLEENRTGRQVTCPNHEGHCSANLPPDAVIGNERQWSKESMENISKSGIGIRYITTDPDGSSFKAAEDLYKDGILNTPPEHQLDTRHVSNNQRKHISNTAFSDCMFGKTNAKQRGKLKTRLASDMPERCLAEHVQAYKLFAGKHQHIQKALQRTKDAIVHCYQGDHQLCKRHSFVCGGGKQKNWITKSTYLQNDFKLKCTKQDLTKLQQCVDYRLSTVMLNKTKLLLNTQKCEAFNRALVSKAPKTKTFTRNRKARVHCTCKCVNRGTGRAIIDQCNACGAPIVKGTRVSKGLKRRQERDQTRKQAKGTPISKIKRCTTRKEKYERYDYKASIQSYKKGMCLAGITRK